MDRTIRFIELYNRLAGHLAKITGKNDRTPFYELLDESAPLSRTISNELVRLKKFGDLRNVIIHGLNYPREVIAEPTEATVYHFQKIVDRIIAPRKVSDYIKDVRIFTPQESLISALRYMREYDFSQIAVSRDGQLALLTTEGIAKWLEKKVDQEYIIDSEATVGDALEEDIPNNFKLISRASTIDDVQTLFARSIEQGYPRLFAVIITLNGRPSEKLLGIITPWDMIEKP